MEQNKNCSAFFDNLKNNDSEKSEILLNVAQLAIRLQLSVNGVYKLVHKRKIPVVKIGSCLRFKWDDVVHSLSRNRREHHGP